MTVKISLQKLLESGAHFGHQAKRWHPKMSEYIYGVEEGVHIFDLPKTKEALETALDRITEVVRNGGKVLLLGTKKQAKEKTKAVGIETNQPYVSERWLGGTFTNFGQMLKSCKKLKDLKDGLSSGEFNKYTKKERLLIEREIARLERFFGGVSQMSSLPQLIFVVDTHKEKGAIKEARKVGVEVIGIVDTNADPNMIDYPIPMNDDAVKAISYVLDLVKEAIQEGLEKTKKAKAKAK